MTAWRPRRRPGRERWISPSLRLSQALIVFPILAVALAMVAPDGANARTAELTHRVRGGESASAIARDYYGDLEAGELLLLYNGKTGTVIRVGDTLKIPYTAVHTVKAGDAWSAIAQEYLGRPSVYPTIARLNGLAPGQPLQIGARILIPALIPYTLQRGESLSLLADRFYGDHQQSGMLKQFNGIADPRRLSPGLALQIPVVSLVLLKDRRPSPTAKEHSTGLRKPEAVKKPQATTPAPQPASVSKTKQATPPVVDVTRNAPAPVTSPVVDVTKNAPAPVTLPVADMTKSAHDPRFTRQLDAAQRAFRRGDYARARRSLETLEKRIAVDGTPHDKAELWRQLTFVYVAFELTEETCTAYGRLLRSTPDTSFDPDVVSPKIRRAVSACAAG